MNYFFRAYATPAAICNTVNDLRNIHETPREDELTCIKSVSDATHWCGNVCDEVEKITLFDNRFLPSIQTVVRRFQESKNQSELSLEELVLYLQHKGDSRWARLQCFTEVAEAKTEKNDYFVYCMESFHIDKEKNYSDDHSYSSDEDPPPFENSRENVDNVECVRSCTLFKTADDHHSW